MPTIIDSLVVMFGLDPRGFQQGAKTIQDTDRKTRDQLDKSDKAAEQRARKVATAYKSIGSEIRNLSLIALGATGIKDLVANITQGDAATGRLAKNLGVATEKLSAWEGAIRRVGGSPADADSALQGMTSAYQNYRLTGTTGHDADFQGLGVSLKDLSDPQQALLRIAQASERLSKPEFAARAGRIGLSPDMINLLEKGRGGVERLLEEQRKLGVVTEQDAEAAIKMQDAWGKLSTKLIGDVRPAVTGLLQDILSLTSAVEDFSSKGGLNKWAQDFDKAHPLFGALDELAGTGGGKPWWKKLWDGDFDKPGKGGGSATPGNPAIIYTDPSGKVIARPGGSVSDTASRIITAEGTGRNPNSSAEGVGQFTNSTWRNLYIQRYGRQGKSDAEILAMRRNPDVARSMTEYAVGQYRRLLVANGLAATPGNMYLMHFLGPQGAIRALRANPNTLLSAISPAAVAANHFLANMTTGQLLARSAAVMKGAQRSLASRGSGGGGATHETNVGTIIINAPHADPHAVAAEVPKAIKRRTMTTQANSGLSG